MTAALTAVNSSSPAEYSPRLASAPVITSVG
jgi:hypothetical protein